jgi:FkbM family methyltransferase
MGAVTSVDLFGLDELLIFSFYWANRDRYRRVGDLGANIGIHSIMLDRCGYEIKAFEPDNVHFDLLRNNLDANNCKNVTPIMKAVSTQDGELEYVRVLGNTTGSHLAGSKENPYGELETFTVPTLNIAGIMAWADLIKMDIEGHEKQVLLATSSDDWQGTDAFVEIGTAETASLVFTHLSSLGVNMFAQKINWVKVEKSSDLPTSYREGSLFLTLNSDMPWHTANLSEATGSERF